MTLENFNENLKKYARLIAETGVNVQTIIRLFYKSVSIKRPLPA